jgi:hypothetical protein
LLALSTSHAWRNDGPENAVWLEVSAPAPRLAGPPDTFWTGTSDPAVSAGSPAPLDIRDPRTRSFFRLDERDMDLDSRKIGAAVDAPRATCSGRAWGACMRSTTAARHAYVFSRHSRPSRRPTTPTGSTATGTIWRQRSTEPRAGCSLRVSPARTRQMPTNLTVVLKDEPGQLATLGGATGAAGVNIQGMCAFTGEGRGIIHLLIADDAVQRAVTALEGAGMRIADQREVLVIDVSDRPGSLGELAREMAEASVNIELLYTTFGGVKVVIATDDMDNAMGALS